VSNAVPEWVPSASRIGQIHSVAIARYGGSPGLRDHACPERCIGGAYMAALYEGEDDDVDHLLVVAHLAWLLARNHCFVDGNKRVAWLVLVEALRAAVALDIDASQADAIAIMLAVADGSVTVAGLHAWLVPRLVPATDLPMA